MAKLSFILLLCFIHAVVFLAVAAGFQATAETPKQLRTTAVEVVGSSRKSYSQNSFMKNGFTWFSSKVRKPDEYMSYSSEESFGEDSEAIDEFMSDFEMDENFATSDNEVTTSEEDGSGEETMSVTTEAAEVSSAESRLTTNEETMSVTTNAAEVSIDDEWINAEYYDYNNEPVYYEDPDELLDMNIGVNKVKRPDGTEVEVSDSVCEEDAIDCSQATIKATLTGDCNYEIHCGCYHIPEFITGCILHDTYQQHIR